MKRLDRQDIARFADPRNRQAGYAMEMYRFAERKYVEGWDSVHVLEKLGLMAQA